MPQGMTPSHPTSRLYDPLFTTRAMAEVLSERSLLQYMLQFEVALAEALEENQRIPPGTAAAIASVTVDSFDVSSLAMQARDAGNLCIPFVKALTQAVAQLNPKASGFVHFGATSQDVLDTATMLQMKAALDLLEGDLRETCNRLAVLIRKHRDDVMPGRTWLQQGPPVTLGLKIAAWLDALLRHQQRQTAVRQRSIALQFGGAVGTLAAFGRDGQVIATGIGLRLHLPVPDIPWHTQRDRIAELAATLGQLVGTLGKIARDVSLLMQTEVDELRESVGKDRGGSSTMPHKHNPVSSAVMLSAAIRMPGLVATILSAMVQEHERGLGGWHAEWETLTEIVRLTAGALASACDIAEGAVVNSNSMKSNLHILQGAAMAEAVSMALAPKLGKAAAHRLLEDATLCARSEGRTLRDTLLDQQQQTTLTAEELDRLLDPATYLGSSSDFIDRVLHTYYEAGDTDG